MKLYTYPAEKSLCRNCNTFQYIHKGMSQTALHWTASCEEYIPCDNLEYLEYMYDKKVQEILK